MKRRISFMPKKVLAFVLVAGISLGVSVAVGAWSPDRPTYTVAHPADHVTFDSITDNPNYGDERAFFDAKPVTNTTSGGYNDNNKVTDGEEILVRAYVHNNAASSLNGANFEGAGVAKNTKIRVYLPTAAGTALQSNAYVSADNAQPQVVTDSTAFYGDSNFTVSYVPGSAIDYNNAHPTGMPLADSIVTTGAPLGYNTANGIFPGCFQYANIVTFKVKVHMQTTDFSVTKQVAIPGSGSWNKNVTASAGEVVSYQIGFTNKGNTTLNDVVVRDKLPAHMSIVPGTTNLFNANHPSGISAGSDGVVSDGGIDIGNYGPTGNGYVQFKATAPSDDNLQCGVNTITNIAEARVNGEATTDTATITITKNCPTPPPVIPAYSCDALTLATTGTRTVTVTTAYSATNGATLNNISYNFGDNTTPLITNKTTVDYTFAADGTYTVRATPSFSVNGKTVTADSASCAKVVTFQQGTPVAPIVTTTMPDTGPGQTIALFAGASVLGAIGYHFWMIRRLSKK